MDSYFVIFCSEDGETCVTQLEQDELLRRLSDNYYGTSAFLPGIGNANPAYWGDTLLIIKGKVVVPKELPAQPVFEVE